MWSLPGPCWGSGSVSLVASAALCITSRLAPFLIDAAGVSFVLPSALLVQPLSYPAGACPVHVLNASTSLLLCLVGLFHASTVAALFAVCCSSALGFLPRVCGLARFRSVTSGFRCVRFCLRVPLVLVLFTGCCSPLLPLRSCVALAFGAPSELLASLLACAVFGLCSGRFLSLCLSVLLVAGHFLAVSVRRGLALLLSLVCVSVGCLDSGAPVAARCLCSRRPWLAAYRSRRRARVFRSTPQWPCVSPVYFRRASSTR